MLLGVAFFPGTEITLAPIAWGALSGVGTGVGVAYSSAG